MLAFVGMSYHGWLGAIRITVGSVRNLEQSKAELLGNEEREAPDSSQALGLLILGLGSFSCQAKSLSSELRRTPSYYLLEGLIKK